MGASHKSEELFAVFYNYRNGFSVKDCSLLSENLRLYHDEGECGRWSWKGLGSFEIGKPATYPPMTDNGLLIGVYDRNNDSHMTRMANDIFEKNMERQRLKSCML